MTSKKAKGPRAKTRKRLKRSDPKVSIAKLLKEFDDNTVVQINVDSSIHAGLPYPKFQGFTGKITGKQGNAYWVTFKDGNKVKELLVGPAHLKELKQTAKVVSE